MRLIIYDLQDIHADWIYPSGEIYSTHINIALHLTSVEEMTRMSLLPATNYISSLTILKEMHINLADALLRFLESDFTIEGAPQAVIPNNPS